MDEANYSADDLKRIGSSWIEKIKQAEKREEDWIKQAENAEAIYTAGASDDSNANDLASFNILHSNVETIVPSIFNSSPSPDIRPRHNRSDPVSKVVADILERSIATQIDDSAMDQEVEVTAQDSFLAGRGITRVMFDADEMEMEDGEGVDFEGLDLLEPPTLTGERVLFENVSWRDFRMGPAKRWSAVPWIAFRHEVSQEEVHRLEDPDLEREKAEEQEDETQDSTIWEIWCKTSGRVYFVVETSAKVLKITDDPLGLKGFFPCPSPVTPIKRSGSMLPVCPYSIYRVLAEELNETTRRINAITKGLKVKGAFAGSADAIEELSNADDNELVSVSDIESLVAMGGLEKAVMWWPIETAVRVLQHLNSQREQTKQAIYEITGISDIIRGQGAASETATAQQIKTQWGALRVKKMQRLIERHVRDLMVLSAEIIATHFSPQAIVHASGMEDALQTEIYQALSNPLLHMRIDVESDSTVRADLTNGRREMSEFLQGTAQFFQTMAPIVASAPTAAGPLAKMYSAFARQFNLGKSAEDALDEFVQMAEQAAAQPQDKTDPAQKAAEAEMQFKVEEAKAKFQLEVEKMKLQAQNLQLEAENKRADLQLKAADMEIKKGHLDLDEARASMDAAGMYAEAEIERDQRRPAEIDM